MAEPTEEVPAVDESEGTAVEEAPVERPKAPPIESRFLFVDVAAMRAKQLRRGARVRLDDSDPERDAFRPVPHKPERVAMEEVRRGLVLYDVPPPPKPSAR
jgi:DNA-directed RNA polymerase subunit K/omega